MPRTSDWTISIPAVTRRRSPTTPWCAVWYGAPPGWTTGDTRLPDGRKMTETIP